MSFFPHEVTTSCENARGANRSGQSWRYMLALQADTKTAATRFFDSKHGKLYSVLFNPRRQQWAQHLHHGNNNLD
jgi:hypothetical protein